MPQAGAFGADYLQQRIDREIVLAKPMGIIVEAADGGRWCCAPRLPPMRITRAPHSAAVCIRSRCLTGWAWLTRDLAARELDADAVIQESNMRFLKPVHGEMRASVEIPAADEVEKFQKMLARAGRGRIRLRVEMYHGKILVATVFDGLFAAAMRR